ncbi:MAG: Crp/Fnr family transcriptional regulator [Methanomassiliicoccaceae archaeon]|nr:Crp/Fnr family transcriptional regulator [Methanomassiliicoccaceae archaeon]
MNEVLEMVRSNPLFQGIAFSDFERMLNCLSVRTAQYKKNDIILRSGDVVDFVGLLLSGSAKIQKEDINGKVSILTELGTSELFGEVLACAGADHSPVTVQAAENTEILFLNYRKIITTCTSACPFHTRLIENMLKLIAGKSLMLNRKIEILSKRTTREKLLTYFDTERGASRKFIIPYNRDELARYLCVDRSAMSNELCKMRSEGLIKFSRNKFEIL